ncbi:MAG TPA: hypothetical protein PLQ80_10730 [Candidatus Syntrophosphaera sp.]|nr:hypothetical protein [Candidatus Syntrophosphaera sp.]
MPLTEFQLAVKLVLAMLVAVVATGASGGGGVVTSPLKETVASVAPVEEQVTVPVYSVSMANPAI